MFEPLTLLHLYLTYFRIFKNIFFTLEDNGSIHGNLTESESSKRVVTSYLEVLGLFMDVSEADMQVLKASMTSAKGFTVDDSMQAPEKHSW